MQFHGFHQTKAPASRICLPTFLSRFCSKPLRKLILDMNCKAHPIYARRAIADVACEAIGSVPCQNIALTWYRDACRGSRLAFVAHIVRKRCFKRAQHYGHCESEEYFLIWRLFKTCFPLEINQMVSSAWLEST
jgi:hypothetical protein